MIMIPPWGALASSTNRYIRRWARRTDSALDDQLVPLVAKAAKVTVGLLASLLVLQNLGYSISGLIAGLGVGGLAVALAAQKTLSDVFGSVMLLVDRPFTVGDWIRSPDGHVVRTCCRTCNLHCMPGLGWIGSIHGRATHQGNRRP